MEFQSSDKKKREMTEIIKCFITHGWSINDVITYFSSFVDDSIFNALMVEKFDDIIVDLYKNKNVESHDMGLYILINIIENVFRIVATNKDENPQKYKNATIFLLFVETIVQICDERSD
ncbi:unnamed protein product [Caenorhabditis angaria]|uniref:Uncharacterized protein n=1 Tax=Caenorhabditis angaria TaxID=860376 RepID=A0A9P1NBE0_9PELO|nr:unnamed protein product [Caenorhabditis angaria]